MRRRNKHSLISLALAGAFTVSAVVPFGGSRVYADPAEDPETIQVTMDSDTPSADEAEKKENKEVQNASDFEIVMAGAAVALNKYLESDFTYDSTELFERIHIHPTAPLPTQNGNDVPTVEPTTEPPREELPLPTETDPVVETPPETPPETQPETAPPTTEAPHVGYKGMAVSLPPDTYVNVRNAPSTGGKKIGKIYANAVADVLEEVSGDGGQWYLITSGSVTGYVKAEYFVIGDAALAMKDSIATRIGTVNTFNLRLRSTPSVASKDNIISTLSNGTTTIIVGEEGEFYKIELDEGYFGYIHRDYVDVTYEYAHAISLDEERLAAEKAYQEQLAREEEEARRAEEARLAEEARIAEEKRKAEEARLAEEKRKAEEAARIAEESRKAAEAAAAAAASQAEVDRTTPVQISAKYIGGQKYVGDAVDLNEVEITVYFQDGHTEMNPAGWSCELIGFPLADVPEVVFPVEYKGLKTLFSVNPAQRPVEPAPTEPAPTEPQPTQPPLSEADALRLQICDYAKQFIGNPYHLGGTDLLHGTDCSGFVMRVFQHFGINTGRTSRNQAANGTPIEVNLSTLRPGDLLFYDDGNGYITHVALYIGNGRIVHAANPQLGICEWDAFYRTPCKAVTFLP